MLALYLRHGGSPDVLKDKFHTAPDKLTRFRLCCRLGGGRKLLVRPEAGSVGAFLHAVVLRCDSVLVRDLPSVWGRKGGRFG